ncbi:MAG: ketopantoate reductase family protein [Proteobacteria bacterium]|nr:ketopantoate reductase family protein [Pseudomonadota bacterium]
MNILIIGPGAVGGYFGGRLCLEDSTNVTFGARGETLRVLREHGLTVRSVDGDFHIHPVTAAPLESIKGAFDTVLVCVKNYALRDVVPLLPGLCHDHTACISLLNGLGSEEEISLAVGENRTIGGVAFIASSVESPGVIVHTGAGQLTVGRRDKRSDRRLDAFAQLCAKVDIPCKVSRDIDRDLWQKLLWNASFNAVTALGRSLTTDVLALPEAEAVLRAAMAEVMQVAKACGIFIDPSLMHSTIENLRAREPVRTSMYDDAMGQRRIEAHAINGMVVEKGKQKNIPTPVNRTLFGLLRLLDQNANKAM